MSVGSYQQLAHAAIDDVERPLLVGGTGLYFRAAIGPLALRPPAPPGRRSHWQEEVDRLGPHAAHALLAERDARARRRVHPNDRKRLVRALELAEAGSSLAPDGDSLWSAETRLPTVVVALDVPLAELDRRIESRTHAMVAAGVVDEARRGVGRTARGHREEGARPRRVRDAARGGSGRRGDHRDEAARAVPAQVAPPLAERRLPSTAPDRRRRSPMRSSRWDAQGNVYLVTTEPLTADGVRAEVADTDGVLEVLGQGEDWVEIVIWNPDGSQAEMSGNGTRIAARWLAAQTGAGVVTVRVGRREVHATMLDDTLVEQDLGPVRVSDPEEVEGVRFVAVDVGNPHAVVDDDPARLDEIGPLLETHPRFPGRTNVQVARVIGDGLVEARVWERGAGETRSSGSSAVAVAAALGVSPARVRFPGGELGVRLENGRAYLTGPAVHVA